LGEKELGQVNQTLPGKMVQTGTTPTGNLGNLTTHTTGRAVFTSTFLILLTEQEMDIGMIYIVIWISTTWDLCVRKSVMSSLSLNLIG